MLIRVAVGFLVAALSLSPPAAVAQQPVEIAFADPQPHFVAAWAPKKPRETERSAVLVRRLSLELADVTLDSALKELTTQAGLNITYSPAVLPAGKRVTIEAGDIAVVTALTEMLFRSGLDVVVDRDGALALVVCRHPAPRAEILDSGTIVGTVTDKATGAPIAGATVLVKNTRRSGTTATDGTYRIAGIEPGTYTVRARYIGYVPLVVQVVVPEGGEVTADLGLTKSTQKLDELVTVTPGGIQTQLRAIPTGATIITAEQIEQQHAATFNEVFRQLVPSAVGFDSPIQPASTPFSLRGSSTLTGGGQVKILVDGTEAAVAGTNPIDPASIERVEVIRGPQAAAVYGRNAAAGVIQIFTKRGGAHLERPEVTARVETGLQQTPYPGFKGVFRESFGAGVRGGSSKASYNLGATYWRMPDWLPDGELSSQSTPSVFGGLNYAEGVITVDLSGRYHVSSDGLALNPEFLQSGFVPTSRPQFTRQKFTNQTFGARLGVNPTPWWQNQLSVGFDRSAFENVQERPRLTTPTDTLLFILENNSDKTSLNYNTSFRWSPAAHVSATLTAGVDHVRLPIRQAFTSQALVNQGTIRLAPGGTFSVSRTVVTNTGFFGQLEIGVVDRLFLTAGLRVDDNSTFGEDLGAPVSPRIGIAYTHELGGVALKARSSYGRAIRSASPGQAFGNVLPFQITLPNPLLGPEEQRGWDAGFDVVFAQHGSLSISGFDQTAHDLIAFVQTATQPLPTFQWQNVGRVKNRGLELEGAVNVASQLQVHGQYSYVESKIEDLGPNFTGSERIGDSPQSIPKHTGGGTLAYTPWSGTTFSGGVTFVGKFSQLDLLALIRCFGNTGPCQPTPRDYIVEYPAFTKLNVRINQRILNQIVAFVSVQNLNNNLAFEGSNGLAVMGRLTTVGAQLRY